MSSYFLPLWSLHDSGCCYLSFMRLKQILNFPPCSDKMVVNNLQKLLILKSFGSPTSFTSINCDRQLSQRWPMKMLLLVQSIHPFISLFLPPPPPLLCSFSLISPVTRGSDGALISLVSAHCIRLCSKHYYQ